MKAYKVTLKSFDPYDPDGRPYGTNSHIYLSKKEAEIAFDYIKRLPSSPEYCESKVMEEIDIEETFKPWYTREQVTIMQKEADEYQAYLEQMEREENNYGEDI